jgi:hypothetical protein
MKRLLFFIVAVAISGFANSQEDVNVHVRFANAGPVEEDPGLFGFDIEMKADQPGTYQRDLQFYFDYSKEAFGVDIFKNEAMAVSKLELMEGDIEGVEKYGFIRITDVQNQNRIAILTEFTAEEVKSGPGFYNMVTEEWQGVARIQIRIRNSDAVAGIKFVHELMEGGLYYAKTGSKPYKYTKLYVENDLMDASLQ